MCVMMSPLLYMRDNVINSGWQVLGEFSARDIAKVADGAGCLKAVACLQAMANPHFAGEFARLGKPDFWSTRVAATFWALHYFRVYVQGLGIS